MGHQYGYDSLYDRIETDPLMLSSHPDVISSAGGVAGFFEIQLSSRAFIIVATALQILQEL
jgi:hypothetical protein